MKHHIIVKFIPEMESEQKLAICGEVLDLFNNLKTIEGIKEVEVKKNCIDRPNRYDMMILIDMDKETLPLYDESVWHKKWKTDYGKYVAEKAIFDSEF